MCGLEVTSMGVYDCVPDFSGGMQTRIDYDCRFGCVA